MQVENSLFPEIELDKEARSFIGFIEHLEEDIAVFGKDHFQHPSLGLTINNQQRRVEHLVHQLVEFEFYVSRMDVWNKMRFPKERGRIPYADFQKRLLSYIGYFREVLQHITEGEAKTMKEAFQKQARVIAQFREEMREVFQPIGA